MMVVGGGQGGGRWLWGGGKCLVGRGGGWRVSYRGKKKKQFEMGMGLGDVGCGDGVGAGCGGDGWAGVIATGAGEVG